ncbi:MAG: HAMP domain-containing histidine kinase [Bacteroidetes bacterium]|nr:HAMP domain-containing histidine kinase [Bacteroidota bacterium]
MWKRIKIVYTYLLFGVAFGLLFPVAAVLIDCFLIRNESFVFSKLGPLFNSNPLHYIIATAPFFLGIAFFIAGRFAQRQHNYNMALRKSNIQLKLLNESYNTFNYHVSHDLKTIITNGQSLSLMIKKYALKKDHQKVLELSELLRNTCENGNATINGFLQLHHMTIQDEKQMAELAPVISIIEEIRNELSSEKELKIHFTSREFEYLPMPVARVRSLFQNMLTNSVHYGYDMVDVSIALNKRGNELQIIYTDNGKGIDMEKHGHKLFKPFTRIDENQVTGSTGIGLYLIKKILDQYNATITLDSEPGKGVKIEVLFPEYN